MVFPNASRRLIYPVWVPSGVGSVTEMLDWHAVRLTGLADVPYAICVPFTPASVGQVMLKVTPVRLVPVALLLIVNVHPVGAVMS